MAPPPQKNPNLPIRPPGPYLAHTAPEHEAQRFDQQHRVLTAHHTHRHAPEQVAKTIDDAQVTDYLKKKGFTKTEAVFRQETAHLGPDGRPAARSDDSNPKRYLKGFILLRDWIDNNLDIYKVSLDMIPLSILVCL